MITDTAGLARAICAALGTDWQPDGEELRAVGSGAFLVHLHHNGTTEKLLLRLNTNHAPAGMIQIAGSFPYRPGQSNGTGRHTINASENKTPAQIARDIERRLLPAYREALAEVIARFAADDQAEARGAELARELATLAGTTARNANHQGYWYVYVGSLNLEIGPQYRPPQTTSDAGSVRITHGSLTAEQARAIVTALRGIPND